MKVTLRDPGELTPYPDNPRIHTPDGIAKILHSIKTYGWRVPIVVDENDIVIMGHGRLAAALQGKIEKVPVHVAKGLSQELVKALRMADNRVQEESIWDDDILPREVASIIAAADDIDLTALGFEQVEMENLIKIAGGDSSPDYDRIARENAQPNEQAFWPTIKVKVSPKEHEKFEAVMARMPGGDDRSRFVAMLGRVTDG